MPHRHGWTLVVSALLIACGGGETPCTSDEDCPAGLHCEGSACARDCQSDDDCSAGVSCDVASGRCLDALDSGTTCTADTDCDDGSFCNGEETCAAGLCAAGIDPCDTGESCAEDSDRCMNCATG